MLPASEMTLICFYASVQVLGLMSLICARLTGECWQHRLSRGAFLSCLVAVGLATMLAVGSNSGWWVSCGATLSLMSVGGTLDLGRTAGTAI
jgi:cell division protein FtsW (lipid II flippase)